MKKRRTLILSVGILFLDSYALASMRRVTQKFTAPVGQAAVKQVPTMIVPTVINQTRQFSVTQPNQFLKIPDKYKFWKAEEEDSWKKDFKEMMKELHSKSELITMYNSVFKRILQPADKFSHTPEYQALQHFADTQAPSGVHVKLCSQDHPLLTSVANYVEISDSIEIGEEFYNETPSQQYGTLLHEYRHRLQSLSGVLSITKTTDAQGDALKFKGKTQKFYPEKVLAEAQKHVANITWKTDSKIAFKPYEYDADYFAISHISCPRCLETIQATRSTKQLVEGYFGKDNIEPFIQAAKHNACCPAHSMTPGDDAHNHVVTELEKALRQSQRLGNIKNLFPTNFKALEKVGDFVQWHYDRDSLVQRIYLLRKVKLLKKISDLDKKSGTLLQHIPEYNNDFIRRIAQNKEFQQMLGSKTLKELDVRNQMEKTAQEIQAGKYKMLEAPQPLIKNLHTIGGK